MNYRYRKLLILFGALNAFLFYRAFIAGHSEGRGPVSSASDFTPKSAKHISLQSNTTFNIPDFFLPAAGDKPLTLFLLFPKEYCGSRIEPELTYLRKLYSRYPGSLTIARISDTGYDLETLISKKTDGATGIDHITVPGDKVSTIINPMLILTNSEGIPLLVLESIFGEFESRKQFYKKVDWMLARAYDKDPVLH